MGVHGKEESKTRAQKRAAGMKKTALFDMVNRNYAATRFGPAGAREEPRRHGDPLVSRPSARPGTILRTASVRAREPGPRDDTT
jgi:hypothetical protein